MKRYWLSIALVPFIVLCIGTYYIQASVSRFPEFIVAKKDGDEKEAAGVLLRGHFGKNRAQEVTITSEGSEYASERSLLDRLSTGSRNDELSQLVEQHRQFMRGKREPFSLYEDDKLVVYANVKGDGEYANSRQQNFRFTVSVLDKISNQSSSYELSLPGGDSYNGVFVQDVQVVGEQLKVITENSMTNGGRAAMHLYTLGLTKEKAATDQILAIDASENPDIKMHIRRGFDANTVQPSRYIVFQAIQMKRTKGERGSSTMEEAGQRLQVYDIKSGQEVKIASSEINDLWNGATGMNEIDISAQGDSLYLSKKNEQGVTVIHYNIPEAQATVNNIKTGAVMNSMMKNQRIYMLVKKNEKSKEQPALVVAETNTGKIVFNGTIELKTREQDRSDDFNKLAVNGWSVQWES